MKRKFIKSLIKKALLTGLLTLSMLSFMSPISAKGVVYKQFNNQTTIEYQIENSQGTICLDLAHNDTNPHGVIDEGATYKAYSEREITNRITLKVGKKLQEKGYYVQYTRDYNSSASLKERIRLANQRNYDLYFSLHLNSCENNNTASGCESYSNGKGWSVANNISKTIKKYGIENRKICSTPYYTKHIHCNTLLFELGFINNDEDMENILNNEDAIVEAIVDGIIEGIK